MVIFAKGPNYFGIALKPNVNKFMSNLKDGIQINCFGQGWSSKKAYFDRYRQHSFEPEKMCHCDICWSWNALKLVGKCVGACRNMFLMPMHTNDDLLAI